MRQSRCLLFLISEILQQWKKYCFNKKKKALYGVFGSRKTFQRNKEKWFSSTNYVSES